jgi:lactoylglutathione lyase
MNPGEFPAPEEGFVITHLLVAADQDRSREFYRSLFEGQVVLERDPVVMKVANTWLMLNVGGGPTDDKPGVSLITPQIPAAPARSSTCASRDIAKVYQEWSAKGAEFLTRPRITGARSARTSATRRSPDRGRPDDRTSGLSRGLLLRVAHAELSRRAAPDLRRRAPAELRPVRRGLPKAAPGR